MQTIEGLKRTIGSTRDLQSLVKTMKAMAAVNIRQYEKALASLRTYDRTIKMGFRGICRNRPAVLATPRSAAQGCRGAVVFGSDQGMCGQLNEQIVSFALQTLKDRGGDVRSTVLMAVGERVPGLLEDSGHPVESVMSLPASVAGITVAVQDILLQIDDWHETAGIGQVMLFYSRQLPGMSCRPHALALLPVDPAAIGTGEKNGWPGRGLPTYTMDWAPLFSSLIRHYLFCLPVSGVRRNHGQRKCKPAGGHAGGREKYRRTAGRIECAVSSTTADVHHRRTARYRGGFRGVKRLNRVHSE